VFWLRMPLPFALNHINLWVLEDGDGFTLVDSGIDLPAVREAWERIAAVLFASRPPVRLICTHFHPDHMGLAGWLTERWGIALWATLGEWAFGRVLALEDDQQFLARALPFYRRAGFNAAQLRLCAERGNTYRQRVAPIPPQLRRLQDGDTISIGGRCWQVISGAGHSPEHAALFCRELAVMIAGDQVLPKISPNVSVWPQEPDADPLALFLHSLDRFRALPADTLVLPSHHDPFIGLSLRLDQLAEHHHQRLAETLEACRVPSTAVDVLQRLFPRPLDDHQLFFAIGESLAHLHHLERRGDLERAAHGDGVVVFHQANAAGRRPPRSPDLPPGCLPERRR
jgi:glyoxylase-like metal-dependent hydrolase (beta-lactamase superfamily II)